MAEEEVVRLRKQVAELQALCGQMALARPKIDRMSAEVVDSNPYRCK